MAVGAATFLLAMGLYAALLPPDLVWATYGTDGGELVTASYTLGVPHPPGYPTYVLLGKLFSFFPLGSVAYRYNLFSAACAAGAAGVTALLAAEKAQARPGMAAFPGNASARAPGSTAVEKTSGRSRTFALLFLAPLAGGLTLALIPLVFQQAILAEVYSLNLLVLALLCWTLLRPVEPGLAWLPGLLLGLALTTHLTSALMLPLVLGLVPRRRWLKTGLGVVAGLLPFLAIPLLAQSGSPIVWGRPETLDGWWWLVSAQLYEPNVFGLALEQWADRLMAWAGRPTVWIALALLALILLRRKLADLPAQAAPLALASAALYAIYAFTYRTEDAIVLLLPAILLLCLLFVSIQQSFTPILLLLPPLLLMLNFDQMDPGMHDRVREQAEPVLEQAPPEAILLTSGDQTTFSLWYLQHVEDRRPDLIIVDRNLFAFDWYRRQLGRRTPHLKHLAQDDLQEFRRANTPRYPVCAVEFSTTAETTSVMQCTEE